jgi:hypothetical protein
MKQTAVEFLVEQIKKDSNLRLRGFDIDGIGKQAKEMEKQQIKTSFTDGFLNNDKNSEQYYNETFNK